MNPKLSLVLPCYNEAENLPALLEKYYIIFSGNFEIEIIVVDNGSTDNSSQILKEVLDKRHGELDIKCVYVKENIGYGHGILQGLAVASGTYLGWTHADLQTDPSDIYDCFTKLEGQNFVLKGKRVGRSLKDSFFSFGMGICTYLFTGMWLPDANAQPKVMHRSFYQKYLEGKAPYDFSLDLFFLYQAKRHSYKVKEQPVIFHKRKYGKAKGGGSFKTKLKLIKNTFLYIIKLSHKKDEK